MGAARNGNFFRDVGSLGEGGFPATKELLKALSNMLIDYFELKILTFLSVLWA